MQCSKSSRTQFTEKGGVATKLCSSASLCRDNPVFRSHALTSRVSRRANSLSATRTMLLQLSEANSKQRMAIPNRGIKKLQSQPRSPGNPPASPSRSAKTGVVHKTKGDKTPLECFQKKQ